MAGRVGCARTCTHFGLDPGRAEPARSRTASWRGMPPRTPTSDTVPTRAHAAARANQRSPTLSTRLGASGLRQLFVQPADASCGIRRGGRVITERCRCTRRRAHTAADLRGGPGPDSAVAGDTDLDVMRTCEASSQADDLAEPCRQGETLAARITGAMPMSGCWG
jgi:hypothetical protein